MHSMNAITTFDNITTASVTEMLKAQHARLAQLERPTGERSLTARNYDSAIRALGEYLATTGAPLPSKGVLRDWRESMLTDGKAVSTVNARLAAARKLLRAVADDTTDLTVKLVLNDWATVEDAKAIVKQDTLEEDYGRRLTLESARALLNSPDVSNLKGLRDRALIAVMLGAGLRVSEVVALRVRDVFNAQNESGQRGIYIRKGKHSKARVVVLNGWNSWVIRAVKAYTDAIGIDPQITPDVLVFRGMKRVKGGGYSSQGNSLTTRNAERAIAEYQAEYQGESVTVSPHDLRRTYAKLCKQSGMSWEALRANMGHSSVTVTERYVGYEVDWSDRIPNWTIELR